MFETFLLSVGVIIVVFGVIVFVFYGINRMCISEDERLKCKELRRQGNLKYKEHKWELQEKVKKNKEEKQLRKKEKQESKKYRRELQEEVRKHEDEYVYYSEHEGLIEGVIGLFFYLIGSNLPLVVEILMNMKLDLDFLSMLSDIELLMLAFGVAFKFIGGIFIFYFISCLFNRLSYDIDL